MSSRGIRYTRNPGPIYHKPRVGNAVKVMFNDAKWYTGKITKDSGAGMFEVTYHTNTIDLQEFDIDAVEEKWTHNFTRDTFKEAWCFPGSVVGCTL